MPPRGPMRGSHLRQVSAASIDTISTLSTTRSVHDNQHGNLSVDEPQKSPVYPGRRVCSLWVHDEHFSREEVLFNVDAFGDLGVKAGDLIELSAPRGSVADPVLPPPKPDQTGRPGKETSDTEASRTSRHGSEAKTTAPSKGRYLFVIKPLAAEIKSRHPNLQISVTSNIANTFGFKNRSQVQISLRERSQCSASHVELVFRDQYLVRADMWRLAMSELVGKPVYKGQKIIFLGSVKATIKSIYVKGNKVLSGYFASNTIPVFRSESARYVLFVQMSREMWDFDSEGTGDILFSRVINGFLPELFKRWAKIDAKHLVTIVLFTRVQYDTPGSAAAALLSTESLDRDNSQPRSQDFYRVVVNDMPSGNWTAILNELKKEFRIFLRDVSIPQAHYPEHPTKAEDIMDRDPNRPAVIAGRPSTALHGNILEAINVASSYLSFEHVGRDLVRTGTSIVVITPGTGVFEVGYNDLALTSDVLTSRAIGIDLICLSPVPLHPTPLFKYRLPGRERSPPEKAVPTDAVLRPSSPEAQPAPEAFSSRPVRRRSVTAPPDSVQQTLLKSHKPTTDSEEWGYGIPHWVDISFWDPKFYRNSRTAVNDVSKTPVPSTIAKQSQVFVPSVRMYEIQMMGVMESEQSNISVPYLSSRDIRLGKDAPPMFYSHSISDMGSYTGRHLSPTGSPFKAHFGDGNRPGSLTFSTKDPKKGIVLGPAKQLTKTLEWMDTYDNTIFRPTARKRGPKKRSKSERKHPEITRPESKSALAIPRPHAEPGNHLENSGQRDNHLHPKSAGEPRRSIEALHSTKQTPAKKSSMKQSSLKSTPRISRSISFALRGLGPAPPRAVASTEVKAEHASAQTASSRNALTESTSETSSLSAPSISIPETVSGPGSPRSKGSDSAGPAEEELTPSRPISIRVAQKKMNDDGDVEPPTTANSYSTAVTGTSFERGPGQSPRGHGVFPMQRMGPKFDLAHEASNHERGITQNPTKALQPWIIPVNPFHPPKRGPSRSSWFGRWQHVYPRMPSKSSVKWNSLKSPAILPLTTEEFPSKEELATEYFQTPYRVYQNDDSDGSEAPKTREALLREMISLRLSQGFQLVVGHGVENACGEELPTTRDIFNTAALSKDGATTFMSVGNTIHKLVCVAGGGVEITKFTRKNLSVPSSDPFGFSISYTPAVKTILSAQYCKNTISLQLPREEYNWNYADAYLAGHRDHLTDRARQLQYWRTRYVLIPVHLPANARRPRQSYNEDNEEEIHLLGINQLTHMWQRYKHVPPEEKHFQSSTRKKQDHNPLNIMYQTSNPSEVVAAELDRLLLSDPGLENPVQLLPDSELFEKSNISLSSLAQAMQGEKGVKMMDRRWHWRLHYNCFVGIEFTTWMLQNFRNIDTREEAVEFGNELMKHNLFHHVQKRHNFRDGNYFYQISDEYRVTRPESRSTWFPSLKTDKAVPSTPLSEGGKGSPSGRYDSSDSKADEAGSNKIMDTPTPMKSNRTKVSVYLSKSMKFDVDPRKRSNRLEIIDLHYDRLHNPDNCFHIELSWLNATPKLVEDAVVSWAATAEKFGLKLVELPISEASSIVETQVFRRPYPVKMCIDPPEGPPPSMYTATSFGSQGGRDKHFYHKAILKKYDFVLDLEARSEFPADVDVSYSWGKPDYKFSQYVHRTGAVLAQITDDGYFLFLTNRLFSARGVVAKDTGKYERGDIYRPRAATYDPLASPHLTPAVKPTLDTSSISGQQPPQPEVISSYRLTNELKTSIEELCHDPERLERFFFEASQVKPTVPSTRMSPAMPITMDSSIPTLELPTSLVRHVSQSSSSVDSPQRPSTSIDEVVHGASTAGSQRTPYMEAMRNTPSPRM